MNPDAKKAWKEVDVYDIGMLTVWEIFEMGYLAAWHEREGEWEDGYKHGYDTGRYEGIKE